MTKAVITQVQGNGTFDSQYGVMYKYHVEFDNGDLQAEATSKTSPPPWKEGDTVWYEVTGEFRGLAKVKISRQDPAASKFGGGGVARREDPDLQKRIENSWAIQTAVQIVGPTEGIPDWKRIQTLALNLLYLRDHLDEKDATQAPY